MKFSLSIKVKSTEEKAKDRSPNRDPTIARYLSIRNAKKDRIPWSTALESEIKAKNSCFSEKVQAQYLKAAS